MGYLFSHFSRESLNYRKNIHINKQREVIILWITNFTQKIEQIAIKNSLFYGIVSQYYKLLVKREANLAEITENDNILCIGGGVCPYTAILLNKYTNANVTVVDNNSTCVERSQKFIKSLGLDKVVIQHCDGECVCCNNFSVVHIALQISPKDAVIDCIMNKAKNGTRVLIRHPKKNVLCLYNKENNKRIFKNNVKHGIFSNVDSTSISVVNKKPACSSNAVVVAS